jgi:sodium/proline symporter
MNRNGALAGMVVGAITVLIWHELSGGLFDVYEILPGFILSTLAIVIVSLLTAGPADEVARQFETMRS